MSEPIDKAAAAVITAIWFAVKDLIRDFKGSAPPTANEANSMKGKLEKIIEED